MAIHKPVLDLQTVPRIPGEANFTEIHRRERVYVKELIEQGFSDDLITGENLTDQGRVAFDKYPFTFLTALHNGDRADAVRHLSALSSITPHEYARHLNDGRGPVYTGEVAMHGYDLLQEHQAVVAVWKRLEEWINKNAHCFATVDPSTLKLAQMSSLFAGKSKT